MTRTRRTSRWWLRWWKKRFERDGAIGHEYEDRGKYDLVWGKRKKDAKRRRNRAIRRRPLDED